MNSNRKADLQRKLAMTSVPKPPAGLAERIKSQIPEGVGTRRRTYFFGRSGGGRTRFGLGIAASLMVLISSVYVATRLLPRSAEPSRSPAAMAARSETGSAAENASASPRGDTGTLPAPTATAAVSETTRTAGEPVAAAAPPARESNVIAEAKDAPAGNITQPTRGQVADTAAGAAPAATRTTEMAGAAVAAAPAVPAAMEPARPAVAESRPSSATPALLKAEASAAARTAAAERSAAVDAVVGGVLGQTPARPTPTKVSRSTPLPFAVPRRQFGISVDPRAVESIKEALDRQERPKQVDVAALVNYFAGAAEEAPAGIAVNLEGSPPPVSRSSLTRLIRLSIDTPLTGSGIAPAAVAKDVHLSIVFEHDAVVSHRLIGGDDVTSSSEPALFDNTSVTALYEVQLRPELRARQRVVEVELSYRDPRTGRERTIRSALRVSDVAGPWADTSRRHRLACLVAIWGETLANDTSGADVARRAEELARQEPRDSKARELAQLAIASSRLHTAAPTGSGR
jgi:hypothetical protein